MTRNPHQEAVTDFGDLIKIADRIGGFSGILADPGIAFKTRSPKGEGRSPQHHYRCETFERLAALPVARIATPDSFLHLSDSTKLESRGRTTDAGLVLAHLRIRGPRGAFVFAVPNGGVRSPIEASIMKGLRTVAGVPDLIILHEGRTFGLELKADGKKATACQLGPTPRCVRPVPKSQSRSGSMRRCASLRSGTC